MAENEMYIPITASLNGTHELIDYISLKMVETSEEFIFTTISQWLMQRTQRLVSKKELVDAIINYRGVFPELEGDPGNGYWPVCGECHGTLNRRDKFCHECGRKVLWDK